MFRLMAFTCLAVFAAEGPNLSGVWHLDVAKSRWGSVQKPVSEVIEIEHREPALKYDGQIIYTGEDARKFAFDGAIDGKEYPANPSYGSGKIKLTRVNPYTFDSTFKTDDGKTVETARTVVAPNDKVMTRTVHLKTTAGVKSWTEVYEKK